MRLGIRCNALRSALEPRLGRRAEQAFEFREGCYARRHIIEGLGAPNGLLRVAQKGGDCRRHLNHRLRKSVLFDNVNTRGLVLGHSGTPYPKVFLREDRQGRSNRPPRHWPYRFRRRQGPRRAWLLQPRERLHFPGLHAPAPRRRWAPRPPFWRQEPSLPWRLSELAARQPEPRQASRRPRRRLPRLRPARLGRLSARSGPFRRRCAYRSEIFQRTLRRWPRFSGPRQRRS